MALLYALLVTFRALRGDIKVVEPRSTWQEKFASIRKAFWGLVLIPVIIGGLYTGFFTPTEAGAVGIVLAAFVVMVIYRTLSLKEFFGTLHKAMSTSVIIYTILLGASLFSYMMTLYGIPTMVTDWVLHLKISPMSIILLLNLYVLKGVDRSLPIADIILGVMPFYICELVGLALITFFPVLSLCLIRMLPG